MVNRLVEDWGRLPKTNFDVGEFILMVPSARAVVVFISEDPCCAIGSGVRVLLSVGWGVPESPRTLLGIL